MADYEDSLSLTAISLQQCDGYVVQIGAAAGTAFTEQELEDVVVRKGSTMAGSASSSQSADGYRVDEGILEAQTSQTLEGNATFNVSLQGTAAASQSLIAICDIAETISGIATASGTLNGAKQADLAFAGTAQSGGTLRFAANVLLTLSGTAFSGGTLAGRYVHLSGQITGLARSFGNIGLSGTVIQTHEDKVEAGYTTWLEPRLATSTYTEIIDVTGDAETLVPATNIIVTVSWRAIADNPSIACKIETSEDGETWETKAENALAVYAENFRYVRYTFTVTGGYAEISNINYRLDVKRKTDMGQAYCKATDGGTGNDTGTWIPFNKKFSDIENIEYATEHGKIAFLNFQDVLNPEGFRIYILDKNGVRQNGWVSWSAYGV